MKGFLRITLSMITLCACAALTGQTVFTLGDGTSTNGAGDRPGPYATNWRTAKYQFIIGANELTALGMSEGNISAIGFDVAATTGETMEDFTVKIGAWDGVFTFQFVDNEGASTTPVDYDPVAGWNTHQLDQEFYWDGMTDIYVESCFTNPGGGGGNDNHETYYTEYPGQFFTWYSDQGGGGGTACDDVGIEDFEDARPNIQLTWQSLEVPPVAVISLLDISSCSGLLTAQEESFYIIDDWLWYFGDGATSTDQSPTHQYLAEGVYDVSLVVSNAWGSDSITLVGGAVVSLPNTTPVAANCTPQTVDTSAGFGPVQTDINGQGVGSENGSVGYEDLTCTIIGLTEGETNLITIISDGAADSHTAAWIDYNANGDFSADELIISEVNSGVVIGEFEVPSGAVLDSTLRMRVMSDFYLLGQPDPCTDPSGGQAEDISVRIMANILPPIADFEVEAINSCDGIVSFSDLSENVPSNWLWQFGDGGISTDPDPTHEYMTSGVFTVTLIVENAFGQDTVQYVDLVTIDLDQQLVPASCTPNTAAYCCGYGVQNVNFIGIDNNTDDGIEGYQDYSCDFVAEVTEAIPNPITIETGDENPQDVLVYVDLDNTGDFTSNELVFFSGNANTHTGVITIPPGTAVLQERLRMRVIGDFVGNGNTGCSSPQFGQIEDYSIIIHPDTTPPTAAFSASPLFSCDGEVQFTNETTGDYDNLTWHFGDGMMSNELNPLHSYADGTYTILLVASNAFGQDSISFTDYITVDMNAICDTLSIPFTGNSVTSDCIGVMTDDGGNGNYSNNSDGSFTIQVDIDHIVSLNFLEFAFDNNDNLLIFDGPDVFSPFIGVFTGNNLPNGGNIVSTGNSITLAQQTNPFGTNDGFVLMWECQPLSLNEIEMNNGIGVFPNPSEEVLNIRVERSDVILKEIRLIDMMGREVYLGPETQFFGARFELDVRGFARGPYLLQTRTNKGSTLIQIMLQ